MTVAKSELVTLSYGQTGRFFCEIDPRRIAAWRPAPAPNPQFERDLRAALDDPLEFPPLEQALVPGDRVTLALDRHTPRAATLVAAVWQTLQGRGVDPESVLILQPPGVDAVPLFDPRGELPPEVCEKVQWKVHDPTDPANLAYLATTAGGERVYLADDLVHADFVLSLGRMAFDPVLGYRGTASVFYPGLSTAEAMLRAHGLGHSELGPDDERPLRQMIDEIAWLLGVQFSLQVLPAAGGDVFQVLGGAADAVLRAGRRLLAEHSMIQLDARPDIVVLAVDSDAAGHGWPQIGAALETARNLVARDGKIVLLSQLEAELGQGMELVRDSQSPRDALKPIRRQAPPDLLSATQVAHALDWANVYLLSRLDSDLVEDLFMIPLENDQEIHRLLGGGEDCVFLGGAQNTCGRVR